MSKEYLLDYYNASDSQDVRHLKDHLNLIKLGVTCLLEIRIIIEPDSQKVESRFCKPSSCCKKLFKTRVSGNQSLIPTKCRNQYIHAFIFFLNNMHIGYINLNPDSVTS